MWVNNKQIFFADKPQTARAGFNFVGMVTLGCIFDTKCFENKKCLNGMCVNGDNGQKSCQCNTGYQGTSSVFGCDLKFNPFFCLGEDCSEKTLPRTYSPSQCESCENGDCNQINGVFRCVCHEGWR